MADAIPGAVLHVVEGKGHLIGITGCLRWSGASRESPRAPGDGPTTHTTRRDAPRSSGHLDDGTLVVASMSPKDPTSPDTPQRARRGPLPVGERPKTRKGPLRASRRWPLTCGSLVAERPLLPGRVFCVGGRCRRSSIGRSETLRLGRLTGRCRWWRFGRPRTTSGGSATHYLSDMIRAWLLVLRCCSGSSDPPPRLQAVVPDAVLVGGSAAALYAGHRDSFDHDHVLPDLVERYRPCSGRRGDRGMGDFCSGVKPPFPSKAPSVGCKRETKIRCEGRNHSRTCEVVSLHT